MRVGKKIFLNGGKVGSAGREGTGHGGGGRTGYKQSWRLKLLLALADVMRQ